MPGTKLAIVAGASAFAQAAAFEHLFLRHQTRTIVFNTVTDACNWLELDAVRVGALLDALRETARAAAPPGTGERPPAGVADHTG